MTGVSGSGKSSLVMDTLVPLLEAHAGAAPSPLALERGVIEEDVSRVVVVDQSPIGRSPRSTAATYTGVMDKLRTIFAQTLSARERGYTASRFSFNSPGGRCEACEGRGTILVEMHFLPDVWVTCETCRGRRFNRETAEIRYRGKSLPDVLAMRTDEALELFANHRSLRRQLQALVDVGLGYLSLGQPGTTLSGGEAQRLKLARELVSRKGRAVYVLDEPTTGLHFEDVAKLIEVLHRLVDGGHSVLVIEHHRDMWMQSDWMIDLGPEGGEAGGQLQAEGPPATVAGVDCPTGRVLARALR